ncbi:MAG TPA: FAD binding domain-containing protein [Rhodothermales bacterium]|nr:FAD binding domain-containing protein [Rhodothermales bacterium]HRR09764.1 FAD binding domain-containing protein [Rhodothermales bacterium]
MITFLLNHQLVQTDHPAGSTLLDFVRYHRRLTGTKIGCREGDCGACTLLVGDFEDGQLVYRSVTSCIMPLGNVNGRHVVTVEGVNLPHLSPVQAALVEENGTQCGFCTVGFVMSLTGFMMTHHKPTKESGITAVDGNICRCTGYKSIERAITRLTDTMETVSGRDRLAALTQKGFLPAYFAQIPERLQVLQHMLSEKYRGIPEDHNVVLGGGTDLLVQRPENVRISRPRLVAREIDLQGIWMENGRCFLGASTTVTQLAESDLLQKMLPTLPKVIKLVSSTQIRNKATLAGNIVNASPIGDFSIFFLGLNADVHLSTRSGRGRTIPLRDFYTGYKQLAKRLEEHLTAISFLPPEEGVVVNFEKVCKRTHLDIASVNSACMIKINEDGMITHLHLSAGGVAPYPKYLEKTCQFLIGKKPHEALFKAANEVLQQEIAPINDVRGQEAYKRLLIRQLVFAHLQVALPDIRFV